MKDFLHDRPGLYCLELGTANWQASVDWYRTVLGLRVLVRVVDDGYALLEAGDTRLALLARENPGRRGADQLRLRGARSGAVAGAARSLGRRHQGSDRSSGRVARAQSDRSRRQPHPHLLLARAVRHLTGIAPAPNSAFCPDSARSLRIPWFRRPDADHRFPTISEHCRTEVELPG